MQKSTEADILYEQISGDYPVWERAVRAAAPELPEAEVQERALRSVLAQFRLHPSVDTLTRLKQRLALAQQEAVQMREERAPMHERASSFPPNVGIHERGSTGRTYRDSEGRFWTVRERSTDDVSWGRGGRCLVFSSEMAVRRVWGVPAHWQSLSDAELERLSWQT